MDKGEEVIWCTLDAFLSEFIQSACVWLDGKSAESKEHKQEIKWFWSEDQSSVKYVYWV